MPTITDRMVEAQEREMQARAYMLEGLRLARLDRQVYNKNMSLYNTMHPQGVMHDVRPFYGNDFGSSRFDNRATTLQEYSDPTDLRANAQSTLGKWGNALVKTGVQTATTFANVMNTAVGGLIYAALPETDIVNNPVTRMLLSIEDQFEEWFPNYRTHAEQEAPWYKRMGTANFWADDIMKNIGFSMGSVAAAKLATKGLSSVVRGMTKKAYREGFEALGKQFANNMAGSEIRNVLKTISKDGAEELSKRTALSKLARLSKFEDAIQGVTGSVLGALGEAQYEGQRAYNDFIDTNKQKLDEWFAENDTYLQTMYQIADGKDENGNPIDYATFKKAKYDKAVNDIETEALKVGNNVFGYETALLSATNFATFRKFFGGGFKNFNPVKTSTIAPGVTRDEITRSIGRKTLSDGTIEAFNKLTGLRKVAPILKSAVTEGPIEEMGQNFINKTSEFYHGSYLNEHIGMLLNDDYNAEAASAVNSVMTGLAQSYGDINQWQDGFAGAIFGIAGVPGVHRNDKYKPKPESGEDNRTKEERRRFTVDGIPFVTAEGSLWKEWKEIQDRSKLVDETVDFVNTFIKSPEQQKKFEDNVLFVAANNKMAKALENNDILEYKDSEYDELMTVVSAFNNAGMNDVLDKMIDSVAANLSDAKIEEIRPMLSETEQDKDASEIRNRLKKEVEETKRLVADFRNVRDDIAAVYGQGFTPKNMDVLSQMLSLANYKNYRAKDILKQYPELFNENTDLAAAMEQVVGVLNLDDPRIDNFEKLSNDEKQDLMSELTMKSIAALPTEWNMAKRTKAYIDISDAFRNFKQAIQLNNEFATLSSHPNLMNRIFQQLYNDHLDEKEKKQVQKLTEKFENAQTEEEVKELVNDLKDDKIGNTLRMRLSKFQNPVVASYLENQRKENIQAALMEYISSHGDDFVSQFNVDNDYINSVVDMLKGTTYDTASQALNSMKENEPDENRKAFLEHLMTYYTNMQTASNSAKPQQSSQENPKNKERQDAINALIDQDVFTPLIKSIGKNDGNNPIYYKGGKMSALGLMKKFSDGSVFTVYVVNDLYDNSTYLRFTLNKDGKAGQAHIVELHNGMYQDDRYIPVDKFDEAIAQALGDTLPNMSAESLSAIHNEIMHKLMYHPLNATTAAKLKENDYNDLLDYLGITVTEPEKTEKKPEDEAEKTEKLIGKIQQKLDTFRNKYTDTMGKINTVINRIDNMSVDERSQYKHIESIRNTMEAAKSSVETLGKKADSIAEKLNTEQGKEILAEGDANQLDTLITDLTQYNIKMPDKFEPVVQKQNPPAESDKLYAEYDAKHQLLLPVTEYDLPDNEKSVVGTFANGVPSRGRTLHSENGRRVTVNGETINIDALIQEFLYEDVSDYGDNLRYRMFVLKAGDEIYFSSLNDEWKQRFAPYYGDKLPFAALDAFGGVVGLVVPDGNISLWNAINGNPNLNVKVKDKWAYRSRLERMKNDSEAPVPVIDIPDASFNGIMGFVDRKNNVHLSSSDIDYYKQKYDLTVDELNTLIAKIQEKQFAPGHPFILIDKGDHFKPHVWEGEEYENFYPDFVHLPKTYESELDLMPVISEISNIAQNLTPENITAINTRLSRYFATGGNMLSKLQIVEDKQNGGYMLKALISEWDDTHYEIDLFRVGQDFADKFRDLILDKDTQESYNIPDGIVISVNDGTMSNEGLINASNIRSYMMTWQRSYTSYNVNAEYDFTPSENAQQENNNEEAPVGAQEMEQNSEPAFTGINRQSLKSYTESVIAARTMLMQNEDVKDFMAAVRGMTTTVPANENEFGMFMNFVYTNPGNDALLETIDNMTAAFNQAGIDASEKNIFIMLFADTSNKELMEIYKDCNA